MGVDADMVGGWAPRLRIGVIRIANSPHVIARGSTPSFTRIHHMTSPMPMTEARNNRPSMIRASRDRPAGCPQHSNPPRAGQA